MICKHVSTQVVYSLFKLELDLDGTRMGDRARNDINTTEEM